MTLEQLRMFVAVAERKHVKQAAQALNVTKADASSAITAPETRYGIPLLELVGRGIRLTGAARAFLDEARAVPGRAAPAGTIYAETMLADYAGFEHGALQLVASRTIASYWRLPRLAAFHQRYRARAADALTDPPKQFVPVREQER